MDPAVVPVDSGIFPSVHNMSAPLWIIGSNVEFRDGAVLSAKGWNTPDGFPLLFDDATGLFDDAPGDFDDGGPGTTFNNTITDPVRGLGQQRLSTGGLAIYIGTPTEIYRTTGGTTTSVGSGFQGFTDQISSTSATMWSMTPWGNWMFATNGIDRVQVYKEDINTSFVELGGVLVDSAEIVLRLNQFVLLLNTSDSDHGYSWCAAGAPENWNPADNPTAGQAIIRELQGEIKAAVAMGDRIAVYGEDSMHIISFISAPFLFGHKPAPVDSIGALSKNSVVSANGMHFGWGHQGIWETNGNSATFIDQPAMRKYLQDNLNTAQQSKICGFHNEPQSRVVWFYPKGASTENYEGIGYNYLNGSWTIYDYGRSAAVPRDVFNYPVAGTATGGIFAHERTDNAAGSLLVKSVQSKPLDLGSANVVKYVDILRARLRDIAGDGVMMTLGFQDSIEDTISWATSQSLSTATGSFKRVFVDRSTGFLTVKLTCTATDGAFRLDGFDVLGQADGADA